MSLGHLRPDLRYAAALDYDLNTTKTLLHSHTAFFNLMQHELQLSKKK